MTDKRKEFVMRRFLFHVAVLGVASAVLLPVGMASATAPPLGPLPHGVVARVTTSKGSLIAVALPRGQVSSGGLRGGGHSRSPASERGERRLERRCHLPRSRSRRREDRLRAD